MEPLDEDALAQGLRAEFKPAILNDRGKLLSSNVRRIFSEALTKLDIVLPLRPNSPESAQYNRARALMLTKLEEACMWGIKAVSRDEHSCVIPDPML